MKVFEKDWVNSFRAKTEKKPGRKPFLYYVATSTDFLDMRDEIEQFIALWPEDVQTKFIHKLRNSRHFRETYHELMVGAFLQKLGCSPEYEQNIEGLTPDYFISGPVQGAGTIIEVFTCNMSSDEMSYYRQVNDLADRIAKIPIGANIHVQINSDEIQIEPKMNKANAKAIETWLQSRPDTSNALQLKGMRCRLINYNARSGIGSMISTIGGDPWVGNSQLAEAIGEKIKRYKRLKLPIVICIVATESSVMPEDVKNVLFGSEALEIRSDTETGEVIVKRMTRLNDGILQKVHQYLAGVVWFARNGGEWQIRTIPNPEFDQSQICLPLVAIFQTK